MKKVLLILVFVFLTGKSIAQINIGVKLNPGVGYIRSSTLNTIMQSEKTADNKVLTSSATTGAGINFGLGGYYQYNINAKISILAEPSFNFMNSRIYLNYKKEELDNTGSGYQKRIASTAKISLMYLNLPLVMNYAIWERKKVFAIVGISANLNLKPSLKSEESVYYTKYIFENVDSTTVSNFNHTYKMDNFNTFQANFIVGIGKSFRRKLKNLSIDLRYSLPFTKTSMYATSASGKNEVLNNAVFTSGEQWQMGESGQKLAKPDNFRMGVINLSIRYLLYKKANK